MIRKKWLRFRSFWTHFGLGIVVTMLIGLSIFLSFSLWYSVSNPGDVSSHQDRQSNAKKIVANKPIQAVYDTNKVILNEAHAQKNIVNYRESANQVAEQIYAWPLYPVKVKNYSKAAYLKQLKQPNHVILAYPDVVSGSVADQDFESQTGLKREMHIKSVIVPLNGTGKLLFSDDKNHRMYEAKIGEGAKPLHVKWGKNQTKIDLFWKGSKIQGMVQDPTHLESRNYLLDKSELTEVTKNVFNQSSNATKVTQQKDKTIYNDGSLRQLVVDKKTGAYTLNAYSEKKRVDSLSKRLQSGYNWLTTRSTIPENMYYFEQNQDARQIDYRLYSDGLPIFNNNGAGLVRIAFQDDQKTQVKFSKYSIQVPLPKRKDTKVTLATEKKAIQVAKTQGIAPNQIQEMRIGYDWISSPGERYVTLMPKWFAKVNHKWVPINDAVTVQKAGVSR